MPKDETAKRKPLTKQELEAKREALNKNRGTYDVMRQQFENFRDSRQEEFEKNMGNIISAEDLEKIELEPNPLEVYRVLKRYEREYIDDQVEEKKDELEALEDDLHKEEQLLSAYEVEAQFGEENPDLDFEGMLAHLERNLSPGKIEEFTKQANGDNLAFLNLVRDDFMGKDTPNGENGTGIDGEDGLPADLDDIAGETGDLDNGDEVIESDDDFQDMMGMNR